MTLLEREAIAEAIRKSGAPLGRGMQAGDQPARAVYKFAEDRRRGFGEN